VKDTDNVHSTVEQFKALGVQLSIDDFGTGYSSLAYLKKFPIDKVKIDQSFVRDITSDANDEAIVRAIVQMARSLGLKTIAEGVEDAATLAAVKRYECDSVQGFHFARPMPPDQIPEFLSRTLDILPVE
jgi:EAL domain-containing protein (putative c-di-GMP-specific phosphodiesterase class I)